MSPGKEGLPPSGGSPERGPKVRVLTLENVQMGSGSLAERLTKARQEGRYRYVSEDLLRAPDFAVKETRPVVDIVLLNFPEGVLGLNGFKRWLLAHPEYNDYELATPEHLDALSSHPELARMIKEECESVLATPEVLRYDAVLSKLVEDEAMCIFAPGASTETEYALEMAYLRAQRNGTHTLSLRDVTRALPGLLHWFALVRKAGN